jgi:pre-mRNA-splicing factor RBM22/SLT11
MLDLSFGLPIVVRDAALKMVAPGPQSAVNREYFAQNHERAIEEGTDESLEGYAKTEEKGRELLRRLARSEPYYRKAKRITGEEETAEGPSASVGPATTTETHRPGPIRTRGGVAAGTIRGGRGGARGGRPSVAQLPPTAADIDPPRDKSITSLFVTGVEDDLPEYKIREFFTAYGKLRSLVCSHMSHCAFVNYAERSSAEKAAEALQGRAVIAGCPLRVKWGKPKPIGMMDKEERAAVGREGRAAFAKPERQGGGQGHGQIEGSGRLAIEGGGGQQELASLTAVAPPPGQDEPQYASLAGN